MRRSSIAARLPAAVLGNGSLLATISARGRVERIWAPHPDRPVDDVDDVELDGEPVAQQYVGAAQILRTVLRSRDGDVVLEHLVHDSEPALLLRVTRPDGTTTVTSFPIAVDEPFDAVAERRRCVDAARIAAAEPPLQQTVTTLYERSLLVLDALADRETGAVVAAPECDPERLHSGGYGFVWPRDLAFLILAFVAADRRDLGTSALRWLVRAQEPAGLWLQRHHTDGSLAPSWCNHQLDETASAVFAYEAAWRRWKDATLDAELWPSVRRAADYLLDATDDDGTPAETYDLWEERSGCHAYTAASFVAAFRAAAAFAQRHEPQLAESYAAAARRVAAALDGRFWSETHGRYVRTLGDATVDVSLLGLAWPFRAVDPRGERMRATMAAVECALGRRGGGVLRYDGDAYAGGNPWVLAALWLGLHRRQVGDRDGHHRALEYTQRVATPLGLLAEQVTDDGEPAWVLPLAWSHAMLVLAARPELEVIRSPVGAAGAPVRVAD